jgi:hypothetical protein
VKALFSGDLEKQVQERIQGDSSDIKLHFYATGFNTGKQPFVCHVLFGSGSYVNAVAQWTGDNGGTGKLCKPSVRIIVQNASLTCKYVLCFVLLSQF